MKKHHIKLIFLATTILPSFLIYFYLFIDKLQRGFQGLHYEYLALVAFTIAAWLFFIPFKKKHVVAWLIFSPFIGSIVGYGAMVFFLSLKATHATIAPILSWIFAIVSWPYLQAKIWVLSFLICMFVFLNILLFKKLITRLTSNNENI